MSILRRWKLCLWIVGWLGILVLGLCLAVWQGGFFADWREYKAQTSVALRVLEDPWSQDDSLLGWKHIPGKVVTGAFPGEDIVVRIDRNGFRSARDHTIKKAPGTLRIMAVGDSFTFGNTRTEHTWPAQLERMRENTEVINMGASGYGVDQMFLWYREDGRKFGADLVIMAIIYGDLSRAYLYRWGSGHGRPRFVLRNDELVLTNVPVPERIEIGREIPLDLGFFGYLGKWLGRRASRREGADPLEPEDDYRLPLRIIEEFSSLVAADGAEFLVVVLPGRRELCGVMPPAYQFITRFFDDKNIPYVDLTLFMIIGMGDAGLERVLRDDGHYNAIGNRLVARGIFEHLFALGNNPEDGGSR